MVDELVPAAWYRARPLRVEAIRYLPHHGCAVFEQFLDGTEGVEPCDEIGTTVWVLDDGRVVGSGEWVVKLGDGQLRVYANEEFHRRYTLATTEKLDVDDYFNAAGGVETPTNGQQVYDWADKPYRLVYDLCNEIDRLKAEHAAEIREVETAAPYPNWGP